MYPTGVGGLPLLRPALYNYNTHDEKPSSSNCVCVQGESRWDGIKQKGASERAIRSRVQSHTRAHKSQKGEAWTRGRNTRERERAKSYKRKNKNGKKNQARQSHQYLFPVYMAAAAEEAAAQMLIRSELFVVSCAFLMKPSRWKKKKKSFRYFYFYFYEWVGDSTL